MRLKNDSTFLQFYSLILILLFIPINQAQSAQHFIAPQKNNITVGQTALGVGYYEESIAYFYRNEQKQDILSTYKGLFIKLTRNFGDNLALHGQYLQAQGQDFLWSAGGSLVYGVNLGKSGLGLYIGVSYSLKSRRYLTGERILQDEKRWGLDYPLGIQVQNGLFTLSLESRYRHFILDSDEVGVKDSGYPLYFSLLMNF